MPVDVTLPSDCEVRVTRAFDAPRQLIWDCHTRPELIRRWLLGPPGWSMPVCVVDLRVGGRYRYVWRNDENGAQFGSFGEHRDVVAPERIVTTEQMDGLDGQPIDIDNPSAPGDPSLNTLTLAEAGGRTTLTIEMRYPSTQIRDMVLQSGMTGGMEQSYQRIDAIAAEGAA